MSTNPSSLPLLNAPLSDNTNDAAAFADLHDRLHQGLFALGKLLAGLLQRLNGGADDFDDSLCQGAIMDLFANKPPYSLAKGTPCATH